MRENVIHGLVHNKLLQRTKTIVNENDIDNLTIGGIMRQLDEEADNVVKQKFRIQETLFGGIKVNRHKNIETSNSRTLFTEEAIKAAKTTSRVLEEEVEVER